MLTKAIKIAAPIGDRRIKAASPIFCIRCG